MGEVTISNSPVHSDAIITYPYGVIDSGYSCGWHTGVDFAPYGTTERNPILYPVKKGRVVYVNNTSNVALGVQCQILDEDGKYWRYCHMVLNSLQVSVGDEVDLGNPIGRMGDTGNAFGVHLHLEYSSTMAWQCSTFLNPCEAIGIPNVDNTIIHYDGSIPPVPPEQNKNAKKWLMCKNKNILIKRR